MGIQNFSGNYENKTPKIIFTNQAAAMANAIKQLLSDDIYHLCGWYISKNAIEYIDRSFV